MSKFKISWMENKTSAKGNKYIRASVTDEKGAEFTDIAIFDKFPDFANIQNGSELEGNLVSKEYNGKTSYTLNSPNSSPTGGFSGAGGVKLMEKKQAGIEKSQDRKEEGIKHSSVIRMSHETALAQVGGLGFVSEDYKKAFTYWQNFFQGKWEEPFN